MQCASLFQLLFFPHWSDEGSCLESQENTTSSQDEEKKDEQKNKIDTIGPTTQETEPGSSNELDDGSGPIIQENIRQSPGGNLVTFFLMFYRHTSPYFLSGMKKNSSRTLYVVFCFIYNYKSFMNYL